MQFLCRIGCSLIVSTLWWSAALAQEIPPPPAKANPTPREAQSSHLLDFFSAKTPYEFWLTCIILFAGLVFAALAVWFLRQLSRRELDAGARAMTVFFVIIATMVLITAGYNNEQIAPAFGLFGTIIGYILGSGDKNARRAGNPPPPPPPGGGETVDATGTPPTAGSAPATTSSAPTASTP